MSRFNDLSLTEHVAIAFALVVLIVTVVALFRAAKEWLKMLEPVDGDERP